MSDRYRCPRHHTAVFLAATTALALLGSSGCAKSSNVPAADPPHVASVGPSRNSNDNATGSPAKLEALVEYTLTLPEPKGAPSGGIWSDVRAGEDGFESVYYTDKAGKGYVGVTLLDCRLPRIQAQKANPKDDALPCFGKQNGQIKGYPLFYGPDPNYPFRALTVNHISIQVTVDLKFQSTFTTADEEQFLATMDLDSLAKL